MNDIWYNIGLAIIFIIPGFIVIGITERIIIMVNNNTYNYNISNSNFIDYYIYK